MEDGHPPPHLKEEARQGNPRAQFELGMFYLHSEKAEEHGAKASKWLQKAARQGYYEAREALARLAEIQFELGTACLNGEDEDRDEAKASKLLQRAAALDHHGAREALMELMELGFKRRLKKFRAAAERFCPAAEQGHVEAQFLLGRMHLAYRKYGIGSLQEAKNWFRKAAEQGHAKSQHRLGQMYRWHHYSSNEGGEAKKWFREAAVQGYAKSQYHLGKMLHSRGHSYLEEDTEAVQWLRRAVMQGHAKAQIALGRIYAEAEGTACRDPAEQMLCLRAAAKKGCTEAQYKLGEVYGYQDTAIRWLRKAAKKGHDGAQYQLGMVYSGSISAHSRGRSSSYFAPGDPWFPSDKGAPVDYSKARRWFRKAAKQDHCDAQFRLGLAYLYGAGVDKDDGRAMKWFRRAASLGHSWAEEGYENLRWERAEAGAEKGRAKAQYRLARLRQDADWGYVTDVLPLYHQAAEQGYAKAMYRLGDIYLYGAEGVERDMAKAKLWLGKAAELGHRWAEEALAQLDKGDVT